MTTLVPASPPPLSRPGAFARAAALAACGAMLLVFAFTAHLAWSHKSATFDEPGHLLGAWVQTHDFDFRCSPDDPPLWRYYVAVGTRAGDLLLDRADPFWNGMLSSTLYNRAYNQRLYSAPGVDQDTLIGAARQRMILLGAALGAVIAWWAWRLAGPLAAVVATAAFAFDPNFLAHAPLVDSDVPITLLLLSFMAAVWMLARRATLLRWAAMSLLLGAAITTKFSGILAIPILAIALAVRVGSPTPWIVMRWTAGTAVQRLFAAGVLSAAALVVVYLFIWACYGFRFRPTPDPAEQFDFPAIVRVCAEYEIFDANHAEQSYPEEQMRQLLTQWRPSLIVRLGQWANDHRFLPQTWIVGLLSTHAYSTVRKSFLCGQYGLRGWWYYFPAAMAFKTPLATLLGLIAAGGVAFRRGVRREDRGSILAIAVAPVFYMAVAMTSNIDLGLRHVLPVYPFLFIFLGVVAARAWQCRPKLAAWIVSILAVGLAAETYSAYPNYIPFFNAAAGGWRGGIRLLSDSNIDWGQELPDLADWQRQHPDRRLYLSYFGMVDPAHCGIRYSDITYPIESFDPREPPEFRPVYAISAVTLQGTFLPPEQRKFYEVFRNPIAVLGGSIYLFDPP